MSTKMKFRAEQGFDSANQTIINVATPVTSTDGANKAYVDATRNNLDLKDSVRVGLIGREVTWQPYTNYVVSGNAITQIKITKPTVSADGKIDNVLVAVNDRIFIGNALDIQGETQSFNALTDMRQNGLYSITNISTSVSGSNTTYIYSVSRTSDADEPSEVTAGLFFWITEGYSNGGTGFYLTTASAIVGTTSLKFTQYDGLSKASAGNGITVNGNTISIASDYQGQSSIIRTGNLIKNLHLITDLYPTLTNTSYTVDSNTGYHIYVNNETNIAVDFTINIENLALGESIKISYHEGFTSPANKSVIVKFNANTIAYVYAEEVLVLTRRRLSDTNGVNSFDQQKTFNSNNFTLQKGTKASLTNTGATNIDLAYIPYFVNGARQFDFTNALSGDSGVANQTIISFETSGKYFFEILVGFYLSSGSNTAIGMQFTKLLLMKHNSTLYMSEYSSIFANSNSIKNNIVLDASLSGSLINLTALIPYTASNTVSFSGTITILG